MPPLRAILALLSGAMLAQAAPRSSVNYQGAVEAFDGAGQRVTSANYRIDSTIGGIGAPAAAANLVSASGYPGQLYDVRGLQIAAPTAAAAIAGGGSLQLQVSYLLDDGSALALRSDAVAWSVVSGPLTGITGSGLVSAGTVSANQTAIVGATLGQLTATLNLRVLAQAQTITFSQVGTVALGDGQYRLQATASSGAPVTYTVIEGAASVSGNLLTITGTGPVVLRAAAAGSGASPAEAFQTLQVIDGNARFVPLGDLAGGATASRAQALSNGGLRIGGRGDDGATEAAYWSATSGGVTPASLANGSAGVAAEIRALSSDGAVAVGTGDFGGYRAFAANLPTAPQAIASVQYLPLLSGCASGVARAVSADATVVAGFCSTTSTPAAGVTGAQAFRWTGGAGISALGTLPGGSGSRAEGISADGTVIVGSAGNSLGRSEAFSHTVAGGLHGLGTFGVAGAISTALAVSGDGARIVGQATGVSHLQACFWQAADTAPTALPELPGATESGASAISADGLLIAGYQVISGSRRACVWKDGQVFDLQDLLTSQYGLGTALTGWELSETTAISPDGYALAGHGIHASATEAWTAILPRLATLSIASPAAVSQGAASVSVTVTKTAGLPTDVTYQVLAGSAVQVIDGVGDYDAAALSGTVHFDLQDTTRTIVIPLNSNAAPVEGGSRSFQVKLVSASSGASIDPPGATATVTLLAYEGADPNGPLSAQIVPPAVSNSGQLTITLFSPNGAAYGTRVPGQVPGWRFSGQKEFHSSAETVTGLAPGDFLIEFESVVTFSGAAPTILAAPTAAAVAVTEGSDLHITIPYPRISANAGKGSLSVLLEPNDVTNAASPQHAQWRFVGEGDAFWRDSGATIPNLAAGAYLIEFKPVPQFNEPALQEVQVEVALNNTVQALYQPLQKTVGTPPAAATFGLAQQNAVFRFVGQLTSDGGSASGVATADRVVLTAAHAVYDDGTNSYQTGLQWRFQRFAGHLEPAPLNPRGAYLLAGYAAARATVPVGEGTPQTQTLDAAALYFIGGSASAGGGGGASFLRSDSNLSWLLKPRRKLLVGYAATGAQGGASVLPGAPYYTPALDTVVTFQQGSSGNVFQTKAIAGLPGMSGGPLFEQYDDGAYYPAGIYLGGDGRCLVRAIDADVAALLQSAELSADDDTNHTNGGQIRVNSGSLSSKSQVGLLKVSFANGTPAGATWRLIGEPTENARPGGTQIALVSGKSFTVTFGAVQGYTAPANYTSKLQPGESRPLTFAYSLLRAPVIATPSLAAAAPGQPYHAQISAQPVPDQYYCSATDPTGASVQLSALGLSFDAKSGRLSGEIAAGTPLGYYQLTFTARNAAGVSGPQTLTLRIARAGHLDLQVDGAGTVTPELPAILPEGESFTLTAKPTSANYIFDRWTGTSDGGAVLSFNAHEQFTMAQTLVLTAHFIPNPYGSLAGQYQGLLHGDAVAATSRGLLTMKLTAQRVFTGSLLVGSTRYSVHGTFDAQGQSTPALKGTRSAPTATLLLQLDLANEPHLLTGTATLNGNTTLGLLARRAATGGATPAKYVLALPHPADLGAPQGDGFATIKVGASGSLHATGTLGDGASFDARALLTPQGEWVLYAKPKGYGAAGLITADANVSVLAQANAFEWFKPQTAPGTVHPGAVSLSPAQKTGLSLLMRPLGKTPFDGLTQAEVNVTGGDFGPGTLRFPIAFTNGAGTSSSSDLSLRIDPGTGTTSGRFNLRSGGSRSFRGVFLPASGALPPAGYGFFRGVVDATVTGAVEF